MNRLYRLLGIVAWASVGLMLLGPGVAPAAEEKAEKPRDLGPPLVEKPKGLKRLDPELPVWLDKENGLVVFQGEVCRADYPLEFFVTYPDRAYEAIVASDVKPSIVHAGLLALGAKPGRPVQFQPEFVPPSGVEVAIEVRWKDKDGKLHHSPAQDWVRNVKTKKALDTNWVFTGSFFRTDQETGKKDYMADGGDFICLLNLPSALLDLPIRSKSALESRLFEAFLEHLPPMGTPVTLILKPKLEKKTAQYLGEINMGIVTARIIIQDEPEEKLGIIPVP